MKQSLVACLLCCFFLSLDVHARPKIGLALSGGGAKGAAHIGVLKELERLNIPVDYIAGTSYGSYIGALYASGLTADEVEAVVFSQDWTTGFVDATSREDESTRIKSQDDEFQINLGIGLGLDGIKLPKGVIQGQTMSQMVIETTKHVPNPIDFDRLPIPFRAIATDIETQEAVILDGGSLPKALQASMSLPGILRPIEIQGKLLVDGGVANNMPIDVVKAMGADIVIAVDISSPLQDADKLNSAFSMLGQLSTILVTKNVDYQKSLLTDQDILIKPELSEVATASFDIMHKAIPKGAEATREHIDKLKKLSVDEKTYANLRQKHTYQLTPTFIDKVIIENNTYLDDRVILSLLRVQPGMVFDTQAINHRLRFVYALGTVEYIYYELIQEDLSHTLKITVQEKPWGPNYLDFKFQLEDDFADNSNYQLGIAYTLTGLNRLGAEWRNIGEIGRVTRFQTEFYSPFTYNLKHHVTAGLATETYSRNYYDHETNKLLLNAKYNVQGIKAAYGYNYEPWMELSLGARYYHGTMKPQSLVTLPDDIELNSYDAFATFTFDRLDYASFAREGTQFIADAQYVTDADNTGDLEDIDYWRFEMKWRTALSEGKHTILPAIELGTTSTDTFTLRSFQLGGFAHLSGFTQDSRSGNHKALLAAAYYYQLLANDFSAIELPFYLGFTVEKGNVWQEEDDVHFKNMITAGSVFAGMQTPLGPFMVSYGLNETDESSFYLNLGRNY